MSIHRIKNLHLFIYQRATVRAPRTIIAHRTWIYYDWTKTKKLLVISVTFDSRLLLQSYPHSGFVSLFPTFLTAVHTLGAAPISNVCALAPTKQNEHILFRVAHSHNQGQCHLHYKPTNCCKSRIILMQVHSI